MEQALKKSREALALAHELAHPFSSAFALYAAAWLHQYRREGQAAQEWAEASIILSTEQGFALWLARGTVLQGWALAEKGQAEEGIAQMRQGLATGRAIGDELIRTYHLALLAETHAQMGQIEEGLKVVAEALATVDGIGERFYEAELYRLKGELTLQQEARGWRLEPSPPSSQASSLKPQVSQEVVQEAEGYFLKAIEIARCQEEKSWELRAVMSLARLWQRQGKRQDAHSLLSEIYGWFTEGFDTKDLQDAKALLEALSC